MNSVGGYITIKLENIDTLDGVTISGIYDKIEGADRPIYLDKISSVSSGTVTEGKPCFLQFGLDESDFIAVIQITPSFTEGSMTHLNVAAVRINDDDLVTLETYQLSPVS